MSTAIVFLFILFIAIQAYFIAFVFLPIARHQDVSNSIKHPISVVICAKNEAKNLKNHLPFILDQDYEEFEVVVMDDHSGDNTLEVLKELQKSHPKLNIFRASEAIKDRLGKKHALREAISKAKYEHLLLTDADCVTTSRYWIKHMNGSFLPGESIVLGLAPFQSNKSGISNLIRYENLFTAMSYIGFALKGMPYMGVGRNLAYHRKMVENATIQSPLIASGDDDLLIQKIATSLNTSVCLNGEAQMVSEAYTNYSSWVRQKKRHYSTAFEYSVRIKWMLFLLKSSFYLPNYLFITLIVFSGFNHYIFLLWLLRWIVWAIVLHKIMLRMSFKPSLYLLPWFEIYFGLFDVWVSLKSLKNSRVEWK